MAWTPFIIVNKIINFTHTVSTASHRMTWKQFFYNQLLHIWIPSAHVWSNCVSLVSPQFLNQAPARAQQLCIPESLVEPHLAHPSLLLVTDTLAVADAPTCQCWRYQNTGGTGTGDTATITARRFIQTAKQAYQQLRVQYLMHVDSSWYSRETEW